MNWFGFFAPLFSDTFFYLTISWPYWLPLLSLVALWRLWLYYIRYKHILGLELVLLEIKLPKEIERSPRGIELILEGLHDTSDPNIFDIHLKGKLRKASCLEIAVFDQRIHFFIRVRTDWRRTLESRTYSQYPGVEIIEAEDYTAKVPFVPDDPNWDMIAIEFAFSQPDPYPLKTYIDYGLDKDDEETVKVDPLVTLLEVMGGIGPDEQFWFQIPIVAARKRFPKPGTWFGKQDWRDEGAKAVNEILKRDPKTKSSRSQTAAGFPIVPTISEVEKETAAAIERSINKHGFDAGVRLIYLAKTSAFDKATIGAMIGGVKQFSSPGLNGLKVGFATRFNYWFQDPLGSRLKRRKRIMFNAYVRRSYFYPPYVGKPMVLNTEELATLFHFPGQVAQVPALSRIESKRAEPPTNLPL